MHGVTMKFDLGVCSDYGVVGCNSTKMMQIVCYSEIMVSPVRLVRLHNNKTII